MNREPKRIKPQLGAENFQTFQVTSPISTHTRRGTCEEAECQAYKNGWRMKIDLQTELGQKQAHYIKYNSGRSFKKIGFQDGLVTLEFSPNQECFAEHRIRIDRPEVYRVKGGDYRGNPLKIPTRVHKRPEYWVEEFAENQDRINRAIERG
jgi:hypothetical protein